MIQRILNTIKTILFYISSFICAIAIIWIDGEVLDTVMFTSHKPRRSKKDKAVTYLEKLYKKG